MLELGVKFLISYFIGSLMGVLIVGKLRGGVDIRTMGSGNAGGTNALRTQGFLFALGVVVIDVGKGIVGAGVVPGLELPFVPADPEISRTWLKFCCAAAAVVLNAPFLLFHLGWTLVDAPLVRSMAVNAVLFLVPGLPLVGIMVGRRWLPRWGLLWVIAASVGVFGLVGVLPRSQPPCE